MSDQFARVLRVGEIGLTLAALASSTVWFFATKPELTSIALLKFILLPVPFLVAALVISALRRRGSA